MKKLLKIFVSLVTLLFIAVSLDWHAVLDSISRLKWWALPVASLLQVCAYLVGSTRWHTLLSAHGITYRRKDLVQPYFIGAFFNNFLPSSTGGDAFRIYHIYRSNHGTAAAFSPVITERVIGLTTLLLISLLAYQFYDGNELLITRVVAIAASLLIIMILFLVFVGIPSCFWSAHRFLGRWSEKKIIKGILTVAETNHEYIKRPWLVGKIVLISALMHGFIIIVFVNLGQAVGSDLPLGTYPLIVPLILVSAGLPITIGGLGVREAAGIVLLTSAGMLEPDATVVLLLFIPTLLLASIPGLFFFLRQKRDEHGYT